MGKQEIFSLARELRAALEAADETAWASELDYALTLGTAGTEVANALRDTLYRMHEAGVALGERGQTRMGELLLELEGEL